MEKTLNKIFQQPTELLSSIIHKAQQLNSLTKILHQFLESDCTPYCRVANYANEILVIEINNATWATQIRYRIPELLGKLKQMEPLHDLKKIEWYIQPVVSSVPDNKQSLSLTKENQVLLQETAESIPTKSLKSALLRLANNRE